MRSAQPPEQETSEGEEETPEAVVDASWGREVDLLLWLARTTTQRVGESAAFSSISTRATVKCLNDLIKLLSRQRRHVTRSTPGDISFRIERNCEQCSQEWTDPYAPDLNPQGMRQLGEELETT